MSYHADGKFIDGQTDTQTDAGNKKYPHSGEN